MYEISNRIKCNVLYLLQMENKDKTKWEKKHFSRGWLNRETSVTAEHIAEICGSLDTKPEALMFHDYADDFEKWKTETHKADLEYRIAKLKKELEEIL